MKKMEDLEKKRTESAMAFKDWKDGKDK